MNHVCQILSKNGNNASPIFISWCSLNSRIGFTFHRYLFAGCGTSRPPVLCWGPACVCFKAFANGIKSHDWGTSWMAPVKEEVKRNCFPVKFNQCPCPEDIDNLVIDSPLKRCCFQRRTSAKGINPSDNKVECNACQSSSEAGTKAAYHELLQLQEGGRNFSSKLLLVKRVV